MTAALLSFDLDPHAATRSSVFRKLPENPHEQVERKSLEMSNNKGDDNPTIPIETLKESLKTDSATWITLMGGSGLTEKTITEQANRKHNDANEFAVSDLMALFPSSSLTQLQSTIDDWNSLLETDEKLKNDLTSTLKRSITKLKIVDKRLLRNTGAEKTHLQYEPILKSIVSGYRWRLLRRLLFVRNATFGPSQEPRRSKSKSQVRNSTRITSCQQNWKLLLESRNMDNPQEPSDEKKDFEAMLVQA